MSRIDSGNKQPMSTALHQSESESEGTIVGCKRSTSSILNNAVTTGNLTGTELLRGRAGLYASLCT
jgi:hypothetical protein